MAEVSSSMETFQIAWCGRFDQLTCIKSGQFKKGGSFKAGHYSMYPMQEKYNQNLIKL